MPGAGRNQLLSVPELRWCMREDIRLEILETRGARSDVARVNDAVGTYNRRCTHFRYRDDDLAQARRDIDEARSSIVAEALAEASALTTPGKDKLAATGYSVLTKDVQELLHALDYAPGPVDGRYGARTKAAVESFERDRGWPASGRISETLRKELLERVRACSRRPPESGPSFAPVVQTRQASPSITAVWSRNCSGLRNNGRPTPGP
jgi:hypothetical protein